jgi:hydroxylamine reductase
MFCFQCEQTSKGQGCVQVGTCGKDEQTAALQDLLVNVLKGISQYAHRARQAGAANPSIDAFVIEAMFATLTNVNFDPERLATLIAEAVGSRGRAPALCACVRHEESSRRKREWSSKIPTRDGRCGADRAG